MISMHLHTTKTFVLIRKNIIVCNIGSRMWVERPKWFEHNVLQTVERKTAKWSIQQVKKEPSSRYHAGYFRPELRQYSSTKNKPFGFGLSHSPDTVPWLVLLIWRENQQEYELENSRHSTELVSKLVSCEVLSIRSNTQKQTHARWSLDNRILPTSRAQSARRTPTHSRSACSAAFFSPRRNPSPPPPTILHYLVRGENTPHSLELQYFSNALRITQCTLAAHVWGLPVEEMQLWAREPSAARRRHLYWWRRNVISLYADWSMTRHPAHESPAFWWWVIKLKTKSSIRL